MRWNLTQSTNQFHYWKMEQYDFSAELKYNRQSDSFRLNAGDRRLFFIERTGFIQNKYLLKTEYSILAGEVYPGRSWQSGVATIDDKKFNFLLKENVLELSSKKQGVLISIEVNDATKLNQAELCALLFSTLRVFSKSYAALNKPVLA